MYEFGSSESVCARVLEVYASVTFGGLSGISATLSTKQTIYVISRHQQPKKRRRMTRETLHRCRQVMAGLLELYREILQSMEECKKGKSETDSTEIRDEDAVRLPEYAAERRGLERLTLSGVREPSSSSTLPEQEWRGSSEEGKLYEQERRGPSVKGGLLEQERRGPSVRGGLLEQERRGPSVRGGLLEQERRGPSVRGGLLEQEWSRLSDGGGLHEQEGRGSRRGGRLLEEEWKQPNTQSGRQWHNYILTREATSSVGESDSCYKTRSSHRKRRSARHRRSDEDVRD